MVLYYLYAEINFYKLKLLQIHFSYQTASFLNFIEFVIKTDSYKEKFFLSKF